MKEFDKLTSRLFNSINDINERAEVLWEFGALIDKRLNNGIYNVATYAMQDFFVEVWINVKKLEIEKIFALESEKDWEGYLKSVRIADYF